MRADRRSIGRLSDGNGRSTANLADRGDSLHLWLGPHRSLDQFADAVGRSFVVRTCDRPGNLARNRLHHRGGQAGAAWLHDFIRTDVGVVRNGAVLLKRCLSTLANGRLA